MTSLYATCSLQSHQAEMHCDRLVVAIKRWPASERKKASTLFRTTQSPASWLAITVKEENFAGEKFCTFFFQSHSYGIYSYSRNDQKKVKTRGDDRKACKPGGRKFGMEINFVLFFKYTKATKLNSLRKILLLQSMTKHFFIKFYYFRFFPFFCPPPPLACFSQIRQHDRFQLMLQVCKVNNSQNLDIHHTMSSQRSSFTCVIFSSLHCSPSSAILFPVAFNIKLKKKKKKKTKKWKAVCVLFNYFSFLLFLILFFL